MVLGSESVDAVLFDAHGTLMELVDPIDALQRGLADAGYAYDTAVVVAAFRTEAAFYMEHQDLGGGTVGLHALRDLCGAVFADALPAGPPAHVARDILLASVRHRLFDDVVPTLDALVAGGVRCGVVSNMDCSLAGILMERGIEDRFVSVTASAVVGVRKPDPRIFAHALGSLDVRPERVVVVGDDPALDIAGAQAAGLRAVLIDRRGAHPDAADRITTLSALVG